MRAFSREGSHSGTLIPDVKAFVPKSAVISSGEQVWLWTEPRTDDSVHLDEGPKISEL